MDVRFTGSFGLFICLGPRVMAIGVSWAREYAWIAYHSEGVFLRIVLLSYIVEDEDMMRVLLV